MIDLETLGTRADSVIISIGAVKFNKHDAQIGDHLFYESVSIDSNYASNMGQRHISEDTINWWMKQSPEAQIVFREPKNTLMASLESLRSWVCEEDDVDAATVQVWGNGAGFDVTMLEHAYATKGLEIPWQYFNARCFRTVKNLPQALTVAKPANTLAHHAASDAMWQAVHLQAIWKAMHP